jgi:hypothetical protein
MQEKTDKLLMGPPCVEPTSGRKQTVASSCGTLQALVFRIGRPIFAPGTSGERAIRAQALHLGLGTESRSGHQAQT